MRFDLRESITSLVKTKFNSAKLNGSLLFSATELTVIRAGGLSYQLRYCPALSKKPEWEKPIASETATVPDVTKKKIDPFLDPPDALLIAEIPVGRPSHLLVLNKYPVIPNHFILATKSYKDQRKLLEEDDLAAAWACLREWEADGGNVETGQTEHKKLFAFFNSGKDSGASQPHRHIQFLPVDDMVGDSGEDWRLPLDAALTSKSLDQKSPLGFPFLHFTAPLRPTLAPYDIHNVYMTLYRQAVSAVKAYNARCSPHEAIETVDDGNDEGWAEISYNLALTTSMMALCPRRCEDAYIEPSSADGDQGKERLGPISLNGTILAANLMVKSEAEWHALRADESKLRGVLETVGLPVDDYGGHPGARL